jgi:diacylglycerol kinase family enzyme
MNLTEKPGIEIKKTKKVMVVINRLSRGVACLLPENKLAVAFKKFQLEPCFISLNEVEPSYFALERLTDLHCVVAVGGDGTVRAVASYLIGKKTPLAIIPAGTFNHLAKDLNIPKNLETCLALISRQQTQQIDVAEVNGHFFLNNASIGLYPQAVLNRQKYFFIFRFKVLAMAIAIIKLLLEFTTFTVNYQFQGKQIEMVTPLVFISNNLYRLELLKLAARTALNKGKIYLYLNHCGTRLQFLKLLMNVFLRKQKKVEGTFDIQPVTACTLTLKRSTVSVAIDGELIHLATPLHYRIHSKQLTVIS